MPKQFLNGIRTNYVRIDDEPLLPTDGANKQYVDQRSLPHTGVTGQLLFKVSGDPYDVEFRTLTASMIGLGQVDDISAADLRDRSTHTGTQDVSTITGLGDLATKDTVDWTSDIINMPLDLLHETSDLNPANVVQTENYRFVTDAQITEWTQKSTLSLGTSSSTAFRGDYGQVAYDHSQSAHAPADAQKNSDITQAEIEAKLTGAVSTHTHPAANITETTSRRFVSDSEKATWDAKISLDDIIDNLDSTDATKVASANQLRVLKGYIDNINAVLHSDDTTLDEIQELVDFIKQNRSELDALGISNIAGLEDALADKAALVHTHKASDVTSGVFSYDRLPFGSLDVANWDEAYEWGDHSTAGYLKSVAWADVANKPNFASVATSGSYDDLIGKPSLSIDDWNTAFSWGDHSAQGYLTSVSWNDVANKPSFATVATSGSYDDLSGKPSLSIANWNAAYSWGNHADAGYITGVAWNEITGRPSFASVATSGSYDDLAHTPSLNLSNWNAAYSWGNHADAGYLTSVSWGDVSDKPMYKFSPGNSAGSRRWVRLFTMDGVSSSSGAHVSGILSGTGDYGTPQRGVVFFSAAQRGTRFNIRATGLNVENTQEPVEFYKKHISDFVWEIWIKVGDYNYEHSLQILDSSRTTVTLDNIGPTAPTDAEQVPLSKFWDSENFVPADVAISGSYNDLSNKPSLGTAASANLATSKTSTSGVLRAGDGGLLTAGVPPQFNASVSSPTTGLYRFFGDSGTPWSTASHGGILTREESAPERWSALVMKGGEDSVTGYLLNSSGHEEIYHTGNLPNPLQDADYGLGNSTSPYGSWTYDSLVRTPTQFVVSDVDAPTAASHYGMRISASENYDVSLAGRKDFYWKGNLGSAGTWKKFWDDSNFNPDSKFDKTGGTLSGDVTITKTTGASNLNIESDGNTSDANYAGIYLKEVGDYGLKLQYLGQSNVGYLGMVNNGADVPVAEITRNNGNINFKSGVSVGGSSVLKSSDIVDSLTSTDATKVASAKQLSILKGYVDGINTIISSDDGTLDEIQELVDYIKQNRSNLNALGISNIAGLEPALSNKADKTDLNNYKKVAEYSVTVNNTTFSNLVGVDGSLSTYNSYRLTLSTLGTGTRTGAVFIVYPLSSGSWNVKKVTGSSGSNHPEVFIDSDGLPKIKTRHSSNYSVRVVVEERHAAYPSPEIWGLESGLSIDDKLRYNGDAVATEAYASNASNLGSGTVPYARLPISSSNVSNWNTAYGWGNHASEGYLKSLPSHNHTDHHPYMYSEKAVGASSAGWYTIAQVSTGRAYGEFIVYDSDSGKHNLVKIIASASYGKGTVTVINGINYSTNTVRHVRILYSSSDRTYGGSKLQVYCASAATLRVRAIMINQISGWTGWNSMTPVHEDSPSGWSEDSSTRFNNINDYGFSGSFNGSGSSLTGFASVARSGNYNDLTNKPAIVSIGETSTTAFRGDRGKVAYDHATSSHDYVPNSRITVSSSTPSSSQGSNGDIWFVV